MILIDNRIGSRHLAPKLEALGLPTKLQRLEFSDCSFLMNGPDGPESIGIELKTLADLLGSVTSGRFHEHQLPGLLTSYSRVVLLVEGVWKPGRAGGIDGPTESYSQRRRRRAWIANPTRYTYRMAMGMLLSLGWTCGVTVHRTMTPGDTVALIATMYKLANKRWSQHRAHLGVNKHNYPGKVRVLKPNPPQKFAGILPGIGVDKRMFVAAHFGSIWAAVVASRDEWMEVDGVGPKTARKVWKFIRQGKKG